MVRRLAAALAALMIVASAAPAQELALSVGSGGFLPSGGAYRQIYGSSFTVCGDVWLTLENHLGFAAGFGRLSDNGTALGAMGGPETYPLEFRRTTVPLVVYYELDLAAVALRFGGGAGIHWFRETWPTVDLDYSGSKTGPRLLMAASVDVVGRLSLFCSATYDFLSKTESRDLSVYDVNLGGFQFVGGLSIRIF
jgi:hypothetical protein